MYILPKPWEHHYPKFLDIRKCTFLTSLDTASHPDAKTLICDAWIPMDEQLEPVQGPSKSMGVLRP